MPLSRGEGPFRVVGEREAPTEAARSVVIAIAETVEERIRLAALVGNHASVVMVSSRAEAMEVLGGEEVPEPVELASVVDVPVPRSGLHVDSDWRVASVEGREVGLSPLEHDLLVCLLEDVGHIRTFESLQKEVWGNDHLGGRSHVQSVVKRLRRKLSELDSPLEIDAVRGVGLRLLDVRETPRVMVDVLSPRQPTHD